jgi:hypothetical protein
MDKQQRQDARPVTALATISTGRRRVRSTRCPVSGASREDSPLGEEGHAGGGVAAGQVLDPDPERQVKRAVAEAGQRAPDQQLAEPGVGQRATG